MPRAILSTKTLLSVYSGPSMWYTLNNILYLGSGKTMKKEKILDLLRGAPEGAVSGEHISAELGITRAAVWKAVDALRRDGYKIEAQAGSGYRLVSSPDVLTAHEVSSLLGKTRIVGQKIDCLASVDSTNTYLKRAAHDGAPDGMAVIAAQQTAGRGRRGRTFQSKDGGLYLSVLLRPKCPPESLLPLTGLAAVAVCDAVESVCGARPQIKWTNDLLLDGKKLCGILTELSMEGESGALEYAVLGIGINVSQTRDDFEDEVRDIATSLSLHLGQSVSRAALAAAVLREVDALYTALCAGDTARYLAAYRRGCVTIGREVRLLWRDERESVFAEDIDESFGLIVRRPDGTRETIRSGEVSVRGLYGYAE